MGSGYCDFCGVWHTASCYHPGRRLIDEKDRQIANLQNKLEKTEGLWQYWTNRCLQTEASRDRWQAAAQAWKARYVSDNEETKKAALDTTAALKAAGEWEE